MKKRYLMLALIVLIVSLSFVSASENVSVSNDLEADDSYLSVSDTSVADNVNNNVNDNQNNAGDNELVSNDTTTGNSSSSTNDNVADSNSSSNNGAVANNNSSQQTTPVAKQTPSKIVTKNLSSTYGTQVSYTVKVLDKKNKPIKNQEVVVTIGTKSVTKFTDAKGVATFTCNCQAGSYVIKYKVGKLTGSNTYKVKNKITLTTLNWGLKGDVSKVKLIKKNMPNNVWVKKAVAATKKGIPLLTFKGGKGKVVFMTAGVHGNELSSQVAAMKMIKHLTDTPIKGTVYIIPFVNVKAISKKVRYTDKDFNRIAANSGTIPNKIVKLVVKYKCDAYGDFHTTKPGGVPGKNIVMGSKGPATQSAKLTNYIAKYCKVNKKIYKYAGEVYPGAISDNVNKKGIPAVICEVMLPHNTVTTKTVTTSYNMMKYLLKFNSIL